MPLVWSSSTNSGARPASRANSTYSASSSSAHVTRYITFTTPSVSGVTYRFPPRIVPRRSSASFGASALNAPRSNSCRAGVTLREVTEQPHGGRLLLRDAAAVGGDDPEKAAQASAQGVGELGAHVGGEVAQELEGLDADVPVRGLDELDEADCGAGALDRRDDVGHRRTGAGQPGEDAEEPASDGGAGVADEMELAMHDVLRQERPAAPTSAAAAVVVFVVVEWDGTEIGA
uniref:Uncharacterized protein n=1 Tax=Oryza meridionalis TaxID=40149 RepID=A0A0E0D459_9ORYZ